MATSRRSGHSYSSLLVAAAILAVLFIGSADAWNQCPSGFKDCNPRVPGCETCIEKDVKNCGACGNCCKNLAYAVTQCVGGSCRYSCKPGWANCDNNLWKNGCETDTGKDPKNCGACGKCCKQVQNAVTKCQGGKCCEPVCNAGYANCDGNLWSNGCEKDVRSDPKNCGACGKCCKQVQNAVTKCQGGKCCEPVCNAGFGNCDGNIWSNGCEKSLSKDIYNCGKCGNKCPCTLKGGEPTCSAGQCGQQCKAGTVYDKVKKCCVPKIVY